MYFTTTRPASAGLGQPLPEPQRPPRCASLVITIPRTYPELEAMVKRWIATCVQSRTPVGGVPVHRENLLVTGNPSLVRLWQTMFRTMPGATVTLLADYTWGRQGTESIRFSIPTRTINMEPEVIVVRPPVPPIPVRRRPIPIPVPPHQPPPVPPKPPIPDNRPPKIIAPRPPRNIDDFRNQPDKRKDDRNWAIDALKSAAAILGTTVSLGVRALSTAELELALEGAWIAFQIGFQVENLSLETAVGLAGEFAAEAILPRLLGIDPAGVFGLNLLAENAPVFDLILASEATSVKVFGPLSRAAGKTREVLKSKYLKACLELIGEEPTPSGKPKLQKAIDFIWSNRSNIPAKAWPKGVNSRQALETFLRERGRLRVPHDHVELARQAFAEYLEKQLGDPRKITAKQAARIQSIVFDKVDTIGASSTDVEEFLEATKQLPKKHTERMQGKAEAWRRRVARMNQRDAGRK